MAANTASGPDLRRLLALIALLSVPVSPVPLPEEEARDPAQIETATEAGIAGRETEAPSAKPVLQFIPPRSLKEISVTRNSIRLQWNFTVPAGSILDSFRIYYEHQSYQDVKTISVDKEASSPRAPRIHDHELSGLGKLKLTF